MTHDDTVVDSYVMGDRRVILVDLEITSLDQQGFENWDVNQYDSGRAREVWPVGRSGEIRQHVRWDRQKDSLVVSNIPSAQATAAGSSFDPIRFRVVMDR